MEAIVALALLPILPVVAPRRGYDSRTTLRSDEQRRAALGLAWSAARRDVREEGSHA